MPVVKASESLGTRPVVIVLYGDPGICKTSLANTTDSPLLLDFDRGVQRSFGRKDTLVLDNWEEVMAEETAGTFSKYKTVVIDTAKAALDDFLMVHVVKMDYKMASNKLKAYGAIGDAFKLFVNNRRAEGVDIVIIAHAKKDEDTKRHIPDVTGQSYQLLMRIADQVGYITMENNNRVISFSPTDLTVGKNVAGLDKMVIPDKGTAEFKNYGADLIEKVKASIDDMNEEQREALEKSTKYQEELNKVSTPDDLTDLLGVVKELPDYLKLPLQQAVSAKAKEMGWTPNKETKRYEDPTAATKVQPAVEGEKTAVQEQATATPSADATATPEKPKRTPKPKAEPAAEVTPAAPVAEVQSIGWFMDRMNKDIWMQAPTAEEYSGVYNIEGDEYPAYLVSLQETGFTYRDLTPEEASVSQKEEVAGV